MTRLLYLGNGTQHIIGVPARDLTDDDLERLFNHTIDSLVASGLYAEPTPETDTLENEDTD